MVENSCTNVFGRDGGVLLWEKTVSPYYNASLSISIVKSTDVLFNSNVINSTTFIMTD